MVLLLYLLWAPALHVQSCQFRPQLPEKPLPARHLHHRGASSDIATVWWDTLVGHPCSVGHLRGAASSLQNKRLAQEEEEEDEEEDVVARRRPSHRGAPKCSRSATGFALSNSFRDELRMRKQIRWASTPGRTKTNDHGDT